MYGINTIGDVAAHRRRDGFGAIVACFSVLYLVLYQSKEKVLLLSLLHWF